MNIQNNMVMEEELFIAIFWMFILSMTQYQNLYLYLSKNVNSHRVITSDLEILSTWPRN